MRKICKTAKQVLFFKHLALMVKGSWKQSGGGFKNCSHWKLLMLLLTMSVKMII
jgi:hypothetical protein